MAMFALEPLTAEDFDFRYRVYAVTIRPYLETFVDWDDAQHEEMIRSNLLESGNHFAILVNGERVGIAQIEETADLLALHQLEILPDYQGAGIGSAVVRSLMQRACAQAKPVELSVFLLNTGARSLYERLGFHVVSESHRDAQMRYVPPPPDLR
jgi:ribosomal protein S18 acetylase RimI-like enzyme